MASIMKMAFVINGALSPGFSNSIAQAQKRISGMNTYIKQLKESQREQNLIYSTGAVGLKEYTANMAKLQQEIEATIGKQKRLQTLMKNRDQSRANFQSAKLNFFSTIQSVQAVSAPLTEAYGVAANFEKAMAKVGAISLGDVKGDEYNQQLQKLTDTARRLGERTQFTATQSAEAMSYLGMAGWKTNQIIEGMPALLSLAVAGNTDLARTADIVSDNLTAFGLAAKDSTHMADVYATVITNTNTNVEMLGETMKYAAPVAHAFGASLEETAAMAGLMANAGIKASQAGTSIRAGLLRLAGQPKATAAELDKLGISISDVTKEQAEANAMLQSLGVNTGTLEGGEKMASILTQLREKFKDMGENEKVAAGQAIFGRNAVTGWLSMLSAESGAFEKLVQQLRNCDGAAAQMEKRMNANARGAATRMKSAYESLQISLMNGFLPTIANVFDTVAKATGALSRMAAENPTVTKTIVILTASIAGLVTGLAAFGMATAAVKYGLDGLRLWQELIKGSTLAIKGYTAAQAVCSAVSLKLAAVTKAVSLAFAATPIGWIVAGVAALVIAGTLLYKHWDKVKTFFTNLWDNPKARMLMFVTGPIGWLIGAVSAIIANWDTLKAYFNYFWDNPEAALFRFQNYVSETFQNAVGNARKKWDALKAVLDKPIFATFIAPAWDSVKASASAALTNIQNKAGAAFDNVKATISGAVDSAIDTVKNLPGTIANAMGYAAGYMYETISQLPGRIRTMVTTAGEFLRNLPRYCLEAGTSFVNTLAAWGTRAYTATVDFLTRTVTNAWETLMNLPDACYNAGVAFVNRLETWGGEAFRAAVNFLKDLDAACWRFLFNLPKICMEAGQKFVSAASKWAQDAYNSIMEWILKLPEAISNTISNAWENIKSKFSAGFTVGVSAAANNAQPVAANAKGGIYNQGAFLTTFAEKSPEAAIPIDNSDRAKGLWFRTGQMLGMIQKPMRRSATPALKLPGTFPANTGYEPKPSLPKLNIPDSIKAVGQLTANLSVPGVFGALVKWLQRPGKKDEEPGGLPAFPAQPAPIVNALAATPNVQVAPTVPNIAPVINAMAKAPDVVVNAAAPAKERKNVPVIRNIIQAVADSPVVRNVVNAVAEVPDVIVNAAAPVINTPMAASPVVNVPDAEAPQVNVSPVIQALANAPAVSAIFDPVVQSAGMPDINLPDLPVQKETLIERIKEFVTNSPARKEQAAPTFVVNNEFHFSGNVNEKEVRETVDRATDITAAKFRELMQQYMREERRRCYG